MAREFTAEDRAAVVERYRAWEGPQRTFADSEGIAQGTLSKWLAVAAPRRRRRYAGFPAVGEAADAGPAMLEVIPSGRSVQCRESVHPDRPVGIRMTLPGGVALEFDTLPPAAWVAELAAELRPC